MTTYLHELKIGQTFSLSNTEAGFDAQPMKKISPRKYVTIDPQTGEELGFIIHLRSKYFAFNVDEYPSI